MTNSLPPTPEARAELRAMIAAAYEAGEAMQHNNGHAYALRVVPEPRCVTWVNLSERYVITNGEDHWFNVTGSDINGAYSLVVILHHACEEENQIDLARKLLALKEGEKSETALDEVVRALAPLGNRFLDPPDGGAVSLGEQVARLVAYAMEAWQELREIDSELGNRAAFDAFPTRSAKVAHAIKCARFADENKNTASDAPRVVGYCVLKDGEVSDSYTSGNAPLPHKLSRMTAYARQHGGTVCSLLLGERVA